MAFQPKSYRKFMVASASAALVGSAVAPAVSAATAAEDFSDVSEDTRHYEHINALYDMGVVSGYGDGTFGPDNSLKRSEAAEMIFTARGLDVNTEYELTFEDVPPRIDGEIAALVQSEIFDGYSEVKFGPDMKLNRAEMAKVVIEAFDLMPEEEPANADFDDLMDTKLYPYINAVAELGIADGYENGSFGVHDEIKRKDFAKMLHNAWKLWEDNQDVAVTVDEAGKVTELFTGVYTVSVPLANLEGADAETAVTLDVDGETVELEYLAEQEAFYNGEVTGYTEAELRDAKVVYDKPEEDNGESTDLGTAESLDGSAFQLLPGVYTVTIPAENVEASEDATVTLTVGEETYELEYLAEQDAWFNENVSADSEEAVLEGTVSVN